VSATHAQGLKRTSDAPSNDGLIPLARGRDRLSVPVTGDRRPSSSPRAQRHRGDWSFAMPIVSWLRCSMARGNISVLLFGLCLTNFACDNVSPNHKDLAVSFDSFPAGVTVDNWLLVVTDHGMDLTARLHNRTPDRLVSSATFEIVFRDCEVPPVIPGVGFPPIVKKQPGGFEGLQCEVLGRAESSMIRFPGPPFDWQLAPEEAKDLNLPLFDPPIPKGKNHQLFWDWSVKHVSHERFDPRQPTQ
jgi:hypothetical protein